MKFALAQVMHETCTFSNIPTTRERFEESEWAHGAAILEMNTGTRTFLGGMIEGMGAYGVTPVPIFSANAQPGGTIDAETLGQIEHHLLTGLAEVGEIDGVLLALHGAGVAETAPDLEGYLLGRVRAQVGDVPIVATLDLHANLTEMMATHADALLGVHLYPHTDMFERGQEAVSMLVGMLEGSLKPTMHLSKLPLIIPTSTTSRGPAHAINERCWKHEEKPGVLDCAFFHGFPYTDVPDVGVGVLVTTDGKQDLAQQIAEEVASEIWSQREAFFPRHPSPTEGLAKALESDLRPIVINETSDNPGGGTPGDGTHLLRVMLEAGEPSTCFGFICDPEVAQQSHRAGVGATLNVTLGGKADDLHGEPLEITAYIKCLTDGRFVRSSPMGAGSRIHQGLSARLVVNNVDVIVCSKRSQTLDEQIFLLHGIDVRTCRVVALKSSQHFRAAFEPLAAEIITVDAPGLTTFDFTSFEYEQLRRPIYPLDESTVAKD